MGCVVLTWVEAPPQSQPPPDNGGKASAIEMVDVMQGVAAGHLKAASDLLGDILAASAVTGDIDIDGYQTAIDAEFSPGQPPAYCTHEVAYPQAPGYPALAALTMPTFADLAQFSPTPIAPDLNLTPPGALEATLPSAPGATEYAIPDAPLVALPDVPSVLAIELPVAPTLDLPTFEADFGAAPVDPALTFVYSESAYGSEMVDRLRAGFAELLDRQSTGVVAAIEAGLWARARTREDAVGSSLDIEQSIVSRGDSLSPIAMKVARTMASQKRQGRNATLERDIVIKRAELQQANRRFAFQITQQFEAILIEAYNGLQQRAYEAARFTQEAAVRIYNSIVRRFTAEVQAFAARAEIYKTQIEAELAKVQAYKAEVEAQSLVSDINRSNVDSYKARVAALTTMVQAYRAQVDAAKAIVSANEARVDSFRAAVQAFDALVKAKTSEYVAYETNIEAEASKIDVYKAKTDAFSAETEGYRATVGAIVARKETEYSIAQEMPIETYIAQAEAYGEIVGAAASEIQGLTAEVEGKAALIAAQERANAASASIQAAAASASASLVQGGLGLQAQIINTEAQLGADEIGVVTEAARAAGSLASQIGAATYSWAHGSVGISYSDSLSSRNSEGISNTYSQRSGHDNRCTTTIYHSEG